MIVHVLVSLLWAVGGFVGAWAEKRWGWALLPLAAAAWHAVAGRRLLVPRRPEGYAALAVAFAVVAGAAFGTFGLRGALFPACACAASALWLLERRSALQDHALVMISLVAAVLGATLDPQATLLPAFVVFGLLLVLALAAVQHARVMQRLRDAARSGYLLAQQIPGYGGTRTGLAPAVAAVAMTCALATLVLYVGVPRFRWKEPPTDKPRGASGSTNLSGVSDRLDLRTVMDLKMDYRVALRMQLLVDGAAIRPSLPIRLRSSAVDTAMPDAWTSRAPWRDVRDADDGRVDGVITVRADEARSPVVQRFELEPHGVPLLYALHEPVTLRLGRDRVRADGNGAFALAAGIRERFPYEVESDIATVDPRLFDPSPTSPDPRFLQLPTVHPDVSRLAREITFGATSAWKKAARIEEHLRSNYRYSLEFDAEQDSIRSFLFDAKEGFCVHFACAMAVLLRSIGIPCRVTQGLWGGEWSEREQVVLFRLSDAHAWVEVWLGPMAGWIAFDPTPGVPNETEDPGILGGTGPEDPATGPTPAAESRRNRPDEPLSRLDLNRQAGWIRALKGLWIGAWKSRLGRAGLFLTVFCLSLAITWHLLPRHERSRIRAALTGRGRDPTGFWEEFLVLAARAGMRPHVGETPYEFGKRVEKVYPKARTVPQALYAIRFGGVDAAYAEGKVREVIDAIRSAQAGRTVEKA